MTQQKITAVIIARNEEKMIGECLKSLSFVDRIFVVDNGSSDQTAKIAKKHGATVLRASTSDFSKLREIPLRKIKSGYVLYVDADERVSVELKREIKESMGANGVVAYRIPRKNYYLGNFPWPTIEHPQRLFRREALKGWKGALHETPIVEGEVGDLIHPLYHYTHRDLSSMVEKTNQWSETEAMLRFQANHPPITWWRFPRVMLSAFFDAYIKQNGWRIGIAGLIESMYQSFSVFITYAKLWELQRQGKN